jgi:glycerophosphoryl diester phosphodiesterase
MDGSTRRTFVRSGLIAGVATLGFTQFSFSRKPRRNRRDPRIIGHRGCAGEYPENTLTAIEHAAPVADAIEVDLRRSATDDVVVIHDPTVDRVTDGAGRVDELSRSELRELSVLGTDEGIPLLSEVFDVAPPDVDLVFDLKVEGLVDDVLAEAEDHPHDVLLSSFDRSIVRNATDAGVDTALIQRESRLARPFRPVARSVPVYPEQDVAEWVDAATELDCVALHPRLEACLRTDLVERARVADLRVEPWTITRTDEAEALRSAGVDGLITDVCTDLV